MAFIEQRLIHEEKQLEEQQKKEAAKRQVVAAKLQKVASGEVTFRDDHETRRIANSPFIAGSFSKQDVADTLRKLRRYNEKI